MNFISQNNYHKFIKSMLITTIISVFAIPFGIFLFKFNFINNTLYKLPLDGINFILGIISIPCCILYYYLYKNKEFFIFILSYLSIDIEYYFINSFLVYNNIYYSKVINMIFFPFLIRIMLLILAIFYDSKTTKTILLHKKLSITFIVFFNISSVFFEMYLRKIHSPFFSSTFIDVLNLFILFFYFYLLFILSRRCLKKREFMYTIFISSISIFTIRRIFSLSIYANVNDTVILYNKLISCIGFLILILGLFFEILLKSEETLRLNSEIKNNEITLLTITENIKDLILEIDLNGRIIFVNQAVVLNLGYSKEEITKLHFKDLIQSETAILHDSKNNITYVEQKLKCKDGSLLTTETVINNIIDNTNNVIGHIIAARDCNFRDQLENLKKKYDEVKELELIRNQFFANLSHEIKTPINIIYSSFQLLEKKKLVNSLDLIESYKKYSPAIKQNCLRLLRLVNNLIDITKLDSGFLKVNFANVEIVSLIENITLSIIPYVEAKNINVVFDTSMEELIIKCDSESIERIMLNLLSNAVKFTNTNGNIFVDLDCNAEFLIIKVKDDGIGIPKEFKNSIFDRFTQSNKSLSREKEGSGIGLALVKSLVELHNGIIYVESVVDKGSEFVIKLPNIKINDSNITTKGIKAPNITMEGVSLEFSDIYDIN